MRPFFVAILALELAAPATAAPASQTAAARALVPAAVISEASLEYLIGLAGKLAQGDQTAHLKQLKAQLDLLLSEKKALLAKIAATTRDEAGAEMGGDRAKAQSLERVIEGLDAALAKVDGDIQQILREIQKVRDEETQRQQEAERAAGVLRKFSDAALQVPPSDAFMKTLSPAARDAALTKARRGADALTGVARSAGLVSATAASAASAGADMQRRLVRLPAPTPTPAVKKKSAVGVK